MEHTLQLSTHALAVPVVRDGIAVGTLHIVADDTAFLARFYALLPKLEAQRIALAKSVATATESPEKTLEALDAHWQSLCTEIDFVFGAGTCALVFGTVQSLPLVQQFFEGIASALEQVRAPLLAQYTTPDSGVLH